MIHDALIVGAGPAGAHLAYLLARRGGDVVLIDKAGFPRDKVCGGGVTQKAVDLLGVDLAEVTEQRIGGAFLTFGNRETFVKDVGGAGGITVLRSAFDHFLVRRAIAAGAAFRPGVQCFSATLKDDSAIARTSRGDLTARRLIAADGVGSRLRAQFFGADSVRYAPALEALLEVEAPVLERFAGRILFDFGGMRRGYGWIFPKRDHLNVGIYSIYGASGMRAALARFMAPYASLSRYRRIEYRGYAIPVRPAPRFEHKSLWLAGDAAGTAECLFGEGIHYALKSAELAADAFLRGGEPGTYDTLMRRDLLPELEAALSIARPIYRFQRLAWSRVVRSTRLNDTFAGLMSGRTDYRQCLRQLLCRLPLMPFAGREAVRTGLGL